MKFYSSFWGFPIIFLSSLMYVCLWTEGHNWGGDFSAYIMQAISIAHGNEKEFILDNTFTIKESSWPEGPILYPWGFPLILTLSYLIFGFNLIAFKFSVFIFFLLFLFLLLFGFKNKLTPHQLIILLAIFAFNPYFLKFGDNILSDIPYLFFSTSCIIIMSNSYVRHSDHHKKYLFALLIGITAAISYLIRTNGMLLILIPIIIEFLNRLPKLTNTKITRIRINSHSLCKLIISTEYTYPTLFSFIVFCGLIWCAYLYFPSAEDTHMSIIRATSLTLTLENIRYYAFITREFFEIMPKESIVGVVIFILTIPATILGIKLSWRASLPAVMYIALTLLLLIIWPGTQGVRYLLPIMPFYIYFFIVGSGSISLKFPKVGGALKFLPIVIATIFFISSLIYTYKNIIYNNRTIGPFSAPSTEMFEFISNNTTPNEIVIFRKPRVLHMLTGRPSILYDKVSDFKHLDIMVIDKSQYGSQIPINDISTLLMHHPAQVVFSNELYDIYRFDSK